MATVEDYAKALADYGELLADGIEAAMGPWVEAAVGRVWLAWRDRPDPAVAEEARAAGVEAAAAVGAAVRGLLGSDVDEQRTTPLAVVRAAVRHPTEVLRRAGVPPVERDAFDRSVFPEDLYGLTPASLADLDPVLGEIGIAWGAAKAWEHRRRHSPG